MGVEVHRGMTHDGLGKYLKQRITKAPGETADIVTILKDTQTDVVVSYLPVGSEQATKWYVEQILEAGCGFVNCIPVFIARENYWSERFRKAGLPVVGDDIKSQVGATIVHRTLARLFHDRGVKMLRTSQLNVGGNMDFYNMLERERLESKKISKTNAVTSIMGHELPADDVYIGPVGLRAVADRPQVGAHPRRGPGLRRRAAQPRAEARGLGLAELGRHRHRRVRCCKLALNHGVGGQLDGPSSYLMKSPHTQRPDNLAREMTETFIAGARADDGSRSGGAGRPRGGGEPSVGAGHVNGRHDPPLATDCCTRGGSTRSGRDRSTPGAPRLIEGWIGAAGVTNEAGASVHTPSPRQQGFSPRTP
jgi:myo-inositol-1-phosphate synthase